MFSFFSSFGASSNFQKHRLILTSKNYQSPDQTSLKKIIQTFRGQDQQTRSQIAFATILKKIHTSDSNDNWIYLLKNLIIFDRVVEENCFLEEIAALDLKPIENYQEKHQHAKALNSQRILKSFWKLIQYKSSLLCQKSSNQHNNNLLKPNNNDSSQKQKRGNSFNKNSSNSKSPNNGNSSPLMPNKKKQTSSQNYNIQRSIISILRSQKQQFLKLLDQKQLYKQSIQLQVLFDYIFKVISSVDHNNMGSATLKRRKLQQINQINRQLNSKSDSLSAQNNNLSGNKNGMLSSQHSNNERPISINILSAENQPLSNKGLYEGLLSKDMGNPPTLAHKKSNNSSEQNNGNLNEYNQKYKNLREEFFGSKLVAYMHLQLLYKLMSVYSNQLFCIKAFISLLTQTGNPSSSFSRFTSPNGSSITNSKQNANNSISQKDIYAWKRIITTYLNYSSKIINYVQRHKGIKGFEVINYNQLSPFQNLNIIAMLDDYIEHKQTAEEPDIVKVERLGNIIDGDENRMIKVERKAQWSYQKALTARKTVMPSRDLRDKNNAFYVWHNSYSQNFPPKQVLTVDLIMQMRQNPQNPATTIKQDEQNQQQKTVYQLINRHSCIYNFRQSNISATSQFEFIPLQKMKQKQQQRLQSQTTKKTKNIYYFKQMDNQSGWRNIYSSLSKGGEISWVK